MKLRRKTPSRKYQVWSNNSLIAMPQNTITLDYSQCQCDQGVELLACDSMTLVSRLKRKGDSIAELRHSLSCNSRYDRFRLARHNALNAIPKSLPRSTVTKNNRNSSACVPCFDFDHTLRTSLVCILALHDSTFDLECRASPLVSRMRTNK